MGITCLIPAYNEATRLPYVINKLLRVPEIDEIMVIDDGSTDNTYSSIIQNHKVKVLRHQANKGKTEAVKTGLANTTNSDILLFDADLTYFDSMAVENGINFFVVEKSLQCLIFRAGAIRIKFTKADLIQTGIRLIRKDLLNKILEQNIKGYQLETAISYYLFENKLTTLWIPLICAQPNKIEKNTSINGIFDEIKMNQEIFRYKGFWNYWRMVKGFNPSLLEY